MKDLDRIWAAQDGKHEIIVKNIHDMLVKLAWDFSAEQLDHLFGCFQVRESEVGGARLGKWTMFKYMYRSLAREHPPSKERLAPTFGMVSWVNVYSNECPP